MNPWQQFLIDQGVQHALSTTGDDKDAGANLTPDAAAGGFIAPLTDLGIMALTGDDAASFLHNQLTNDVEHLGPSEARLAAYCSPKGRMLASFLMWRRADAIMLQLPREIQAPIQKRLQMFILRSKVKLVDITDQHALLGIGGQAAGQALTEFFGQLPAAPYGKIDADAGTLIRLTDAFGSPRYQWIADVDTAKNAWSKLARSLQPAGAALWRLADIQAGVPQIVQPTQEKFVPQMINFEIIGGVNFKKGCYPGQEIVARSQYLGKLKRRMLLADVETDAANAGMEVYSSADPEQPCGMIVNAERTSPDTFAVLVELKTAAVNDGGIHLGAASGPPLRIQALPYALPDAD